MDRTDERRHEHARDVTDDRRTDGGSSTTRECHRRGCDRPAEFVVLERYQEETGQGAVEAEAVLCRDHTAEEHPTNLDGVYPDYVFRVDPLAEDG